MYFFDDVQLPALFHLGLGPAVVHPAAGRVQPLAVVGADDHDGALEVDVGQERVERVALDHHQDRRRTGKVDEHRPRSGSGPARGPSEPHAPGLRPPARPDC